MQMFIKLILIACLSFIILISNQQAHGKIFIITFDSEDSYLNKNTVDQLNVEQTFIPVDEDNAVRAEDNHVTLDLGKKNVRSTEIYKFGRRTSNDSLIIKATDSFQYDDVINVILNICYPKSGIGSIVKYVYIEVDQLSFGNATIISGGIGERSICISIFAKTTYYLNYRASFYGYN
ncbi:uncharacterized protein LOC129619132 [Condylostylus longicornis]|uniref:uncharacterized protein LOC129619132 n=1 Tax=Condylostylus longicornis TaxID=2530218 RepID=UPI00244DDB70|nr:uncharacterized protein LOC129619132 [Condylostylus longicornis]